MQVLKCKMCGGSVTVEPGQSIGECEYCGSVQTLTKTQDETIINLYNRANNLRLKCEFDKAGAVYEKIVEADDAEAEAHWGIVLCKYGIEYVEDPKSHARIPTCHRTLYDAITKDADYLAAIDYSDPAQQEIYEKEARAIDRIQRDILAIVKNEKPFDVFLCYKETGADGKRTIDSTLANDIYYQLTQEGFKVFYAAITLEDKLGQEYEPYIFAAMNSAKVMLAIGTKPEHFNAVWVKNEWSRFLSLMKTDRSKTLIPCYRDMDAYDLPEEFAHLQAQDMSKIGFIPDLVRGIKKLIVKEEPKKVEQAATDNESLLKQAFHLLADGEWYDATLYCEQVLKQDFQNADAYLGKLMAELQVKNRWQLENVNAPFDNRDSYCNAILYGDEKLKKELKGYITQIIKHNEAERLENLYSSAFLSMQHAKNETDYFQAAAQFDAIESYNDSSILSSECRKKAQNIINYRREDAAEPDIIYTQFPDGYAVTGIKKDPTAVHIPSFHCGQPVVEICTSAFSKKKNLIRVDIPDTVKRIDFRAFEGCANLTSITIPSSVLQIEYSAFTDCSSLVSISVDAENQYYHSAGNCLIENASRTLIAGCKKSIIPTDGSVTNIGFQAFSGCYDLKKINIPYSVTRIGDCAFSGCSNITSISVDIGNKAYHSSGNCLIETKTKTLIAGCKNSIIPTDGSVKSIGCQAFSGCSDIKSITIPHGVTSIGDWAFYNCINLKCIVIPESVTEFGEDAFSCCSSLNKIKYQGTKIRWQQISKGSYWDIATGYYIIHCKFGTIAKDQ